MHDFRKILNPNFVHEFYFCLFPDKYLKKYVSTQGVEWEVGVGGLPVFLSTSEIFGSFSQSVYTIYNCRESNRRLVRVGGAEAELKRSHWGEPLRGGVNKSGFLGIVETKDR